MTMLLDYSRRRVLFLSRSFFYEIKNKYDLIIKIYLILINKNIKNYHVSFISDRMEIGTGHCARENTSMIASLEAVLGISLRIRVFCSGFTFGRITSFITRKFLIDIIN